MVNNKNESLENHIALDLLRFNIWWNWIKWYDKEKKEIYGDPDKGIETSDDFYTFIKDYYDEVFSDTLGRDNRLFLYQNALDISRYLQKYLLWDFSSIEAITLSINKWFLRYQDKSWIPHIIDIRPISSYEEFLDREGARISEARDDLKEELETESYLWGALLIGYVVWARAWVHVVDRVLLRTQSGNYETIRFKNEGIDFSKDTVPKKILRALGNRGFRFDPINWAFEFLDRKVLEASYYTRGIKIFKNTTYAEYMKDENNPRMTEQEFERKKTGLMTQIEKLEYGYERYLQEARSETRSSWKELVTDGSKRIWKEVMSKEAYFIKHDIVGKFGKWGFGWAVQHTLFLPVFFESIHHNHQDLTAYLKALSEYELFMQWAKYGANIARRLPGNSQLEWVYSLVGWLLGWWGAVITGEWAAWPLALDKKAWQSIGNWREDFWYKMWAGEGNFFWVDTIGMGTAHDAIDRAEVNDNPVVDFFTDSKMDTDTSVDKYMSSSIGRNVNFWNEKVDTYKLSMKRELRQLIKDYREDTGVFMNPEWMEFDDRYIYLASFGNLTSYNGEIPKEEKDRIFRKELRKMLDYYGSIRASELPKDEDRRWRRWRNRGNRSYYSDWEKQKDTQWIDGELYRWYFGMVKKNIFDLFDAYIENGNLEEVISSNKAWTSTDFLLENYLSYMYIDEDFLLEQRSLQKVKLEEIILGTINGTPSLYPEVAKLPSEKRAFVKTIFGRIMAKAPLWEEQYFMDKIDETYPWPAQMARSLAISQKTWEQKSEREKFEELLDVEGKEWRNEFVQFLNYMVEYKRANELLNNLESGSWYWVKWNIPDFVGDL